MLRFLHISLILLLASFNSYSQNEMEVKSIAMKSKSDCFQVIDSDDEGFTAVFLRNKEISLRKIGFDGSVIAQNEFSEKNPLDGRLGVNIDVLKDGNSAVIAISQGVAMKESETLLLSIDLEALNFTKSVIVASPQQKNGKKVHTIIRKGIAENIMVLNLGEVSDDETSVSVNVYDKDLKSLQTFEKTLEINHERVRFAGNSKVNDNMSLFFYDYGKEQISDLMEINGSGVESRTLKSEDMHNVHVIPSNEDEIFIVELIRKTPMDCHVQMHKVALKNWEYLKSTEPEGLGAILPMDSRVAIVDFLGKKEYERMGVIPSGVSLRVVRVTNDDILLCFDRGTLFADVLNTRTSLTTITFSSGFEVVQKSNFRKMSTDGLDTYNDGIVLLDQQDKVSLVYVDHMQKGLLSSEVNGSSSATTKLFDIDDPLNSHWNMRNASNCNGQVFIPVTLNKDEVIIVR